MFVFVAVFGGNNFCWGLFFFQTGSEKSQMELTRPQPFKLSQAKSTSSLQAAEKYQSVAERVAAFHSKTPDRFKTKGQGMIQLEYIDF